MSETVRSYTGNAHGPAPRRRRFSVRGKVLFLVFVVLLIGYGWWTTRDSYPIENLIPADQAYQVLAVDILGARDALVQSKMLKALPPEAGLGDVAGLLAGNLGIPEWVLNNLVPNVCVLSGKDVRTFGDPLLVTRMTRVGCLLMKLHCMMPGIECEPAGGLHLSRVRDAGVYVARRGRVLALSPSREALIRALTLRREDGVTRESMAGAFREASSGDLVGTLSLGSGDPLGGVFDKLRFAVRIESASARIKCSGVLRKEWRDRLGGFIEDLAPAELMAPPEGIVQVSMNFGKPIRDLWSVAAQLAGMGGEAEALWQKWSTPPRDAAPGLAQMAAALFGQLGPGIRVSWRGIDLNEMVPAPQVVATFDADPEAVLAVFGALPPLAGDATRYAMQPQYDAAAKCVRLPLVGGPSMEPTAGIIGDTLLVSSSRTLAEALLSAGPKEEKLPQPGNLYAVMQPQACAEALANLASLFAENSLLKGYSPASVQAAAAPWLGCASAVKDITAFALCENGEVELDLAINGN